jgi:protein-S-isoprenylcysteine O-methyltransferase Ste14
MHGPRPLYWTNPVAGLTFWTTVAIWGAAELRQSSRTRADATVQDQGSRWAVRLSIAGAWLIALRSATRLTSATIRTQSDLVFILALVVLWTGIGLRLWAFRTLGRYFTFTVMTSADQSVVSNGPYRIIRHPGYAGAGRWH